MRILLISNFGPLFQAEWIYRYLIKQNHSVVTVGKVYNKELKWYKHTQKRMGNNHLPLFWKGETDDYGLPEFHIDIQTLFEMLGDEWDAIIECECYNLKVTDKNSFLHTFYSDIPYFFYKCELLSDYVSPIATHYFYAAIPILEHLKKLNPEVTNENCFYLPFTVDPEEVKPNPQVEPEYDLFFAGYVPDGKQEFKPEFQEAYAKRKEVIEHLEKNFNGVFKCVKSRIWDYDKYLEELQKARVVLNIGIGCFNIRDFEAIAMGKALLTLDHSEYFKNAYAISMTYEGFSSKHNALNNASHFKEHPNQAIAMGKRALDFFKVKHHPNKRIKVIIEAIENARSRN